MQDARMLVTAPRRVRSAAPRRALARERTRGAALARERARLRAHFREVLAELRRRDVAHLREDQRVTRARLLEELARYARAGRFPRNTDFPGARAPYFVDAFGTRCAMAHLIEATGEAGLVARVAATMNNALVRAMEGDVALAAWLERAGLTAAEAGRIQPSYCFITTAEECLCNEVSTTQSDLSMTVAEATVLATSADGGGVMARIDVVHGDMTLATAGQEVMVSGDGEVGEAVLVMVTQNAKKMMTSYRSLASVAKDGTVALSCAYDVPALKKQDAINALLKGVEAQGDSTACSGALAKVDGRWGESVCGDEGCSAAASSGGSPVVVGALFLAAALWSRRRRSRRPRLAGH